MPAEQAPHDLQLERALLALVLSDNGVLDRVTRLEPEHFSMRSTAKCSR